MRKLSRTLIFWMLISLLVMLGYGIIDSLADEQSGSTYLKNSLSELTGADRDLYQQFVSVLSNDNEYNRLGYTAEQFRYLVTKSNCLILALNIRHPDVSSSGELEMLGRPQIEMVTQINDLEGYRGTLMDQLTYNADLDSTLSNLAGYMKSFYTTFSEGSYWGIIKTFLTIGSDKLVIKPLTDQLTNHAFNSLYQGYSAERQQGKDPGSAFDSVNDVNGQNWNDMKTILGFYINLNEKAKLGWGTETINGLVSRYLEDRYKTENKMAFAPWEVPVVKPENAMENMFRDALHEIKLQNMKYLRTFTESCVREMPSQEVCPSGQTNCRGSCTDTGSDANNCGSCGNACPSGYNCLEGSCSKSETTSKLVLDHFDVIATKYWNEGEGGTYILFNKTNVSSGQRHFEAENDSTWDTGHFNMKLTTDIDLPNLVPINNGKYNFNGSIKASASWDSAGLGLSRTAELDINGGNKNIESGIENRQVTLTNQSVMTYSEELGNDNEIAADFNVAAVTDVEQWVNPSIEIDVHAIYKYQI